MEPACFSYELESRGFPNGGMRFGACPINFRRNLNNLNFVFLPFLWQGLGEGAELSARKPSHPTLFQREREKNINS